MVERDVREGQHRNASERLPLFTTAYFHKPEELRHEIDSAGFEVQNLFGLEGPGCVLSDVDQRADDLLRREELLRVARAVETEPRCSASAITCLLSRAKQRMKFIDGRKRSSISFAIRSTRLRGPETMRCSASFTAL